MEMADMTLGLVDHLLLQILSLLPTKDALRTCVLSSRWSDLWRSLSFIDVEDTMPILDRCPCYPHCRIPFLLLVDRLVHSHNDSDITRFRVSCDIRVDDIRFESWISSVIHHNVKEIDLRFPLSGSCSLPSCLFSSRSLTTLSIRVQYGELGFPSSLSATCPCLKILNLSQVRFLNDLPTKRLFFHMSSIFPRLEKLSLIKCSWRNIKGLGIRSSTVEEIALDIDGSDLLECEVVICAPKLSRFYCDTDTTIGIQLVDPNIIADASLDFIYPTNDEQEVVHQRLTRLLFAMRNSSRLTLSTETLSATRSFYEHVPVLRNLKDLDITGFVNETTVEDTMEFMHKTPNLEYLAFYLENDNDNDNDDDDDMDDWWSDDPIPGCALHKLKFLKVEGLDAVEVEMDLIKIFLENAPNLEEVEVNAHERNAEKLETVRNEIEELPRSSENCAFFFEVKTDDEEDNL